MKYCKSVDRELVEGCRVYENDTVWHSAFRQPVGLWEPWTGHFTFLCLSFFIFKMSKHTYLYGFYEDQTS